MINNIFWWRGMQCFVDFKNFAYKSELFTIKKMAVMGGKNEKERNGF